MHTYVTVYLLSCTLTKNLSLSNCDGHLTFWSTGDLQDMSIDHNMHS